MHPNRRQFLRASGFLAGSGLVSASAENSANHHRTVDEAITQADSQLFSRFVDSHGVILDYEADLPTPEDCALGRPNAIGWWSPIENGPMFTGLYLPALCERARRSGSAGDREKASRLAQGLIKCASVSDVPGFIARGMGSDGICHYPMGSDDQTHPWFQGLHAYVTSGLATSDENERIIAKMVEVAEVLQSTRWRCPCDGAFKGQFRGGYLGHWFRDAVRYLYLLRAMHEVTKDALWLDRYHQALRQTPEKSVHTRLELCAQGFAADRHEIKNIETSQLWIYVGCQRSLRMLAGMEADESIRRHYLAGLTAIATDALPAVAEHGSFDNHDKQPFGHRDWRDLYTTWFPQPTQAEAERLAKAPVDAKLSGRKKYEARYVRNPLAGAALLAIAGDSAHRGAVEKAICHYDYSKLNMAEFFFAECAHYAPWVAA